MLLTEQRICVVMIAVCMATAPIAGTAAQETGTSAIDQLLSKRIESIDSQPMPVRDALVQALRGAQVAGGIAICHCHRSEPPITIDRGSSITSALDRARAVVPELTISARSKGVINILDSQVLDLFETRISNVTITSPTHGSVAIHEILNTPEALAREAVLKVQESNSQLGFSSIPRPGTQPEPSTQLKLTNVTIREALNIVAAAKGFGVWVYEERECSANGGRSFALTFAVQ